MLLRQHTTIGAVVPEPLILHVTLLKVNALLYGKPCRYCGAWMEYTDDPAVSETSSSSFSSRPSPQTVSSSSKQTPKTDVVMHRNSLEAFEDVEQLAPQMAGDSVDWSVSRSLGATSHGLEDADDSSDEDDDDDDDEGHWGIGASFLYVECFCLVVFLL